MQMPIELMVNKTEAHHEMFDGNIMHDDYLAFIGKQFNTKN
jgi:hypothetical protein